MQIIGPAAFWRKPPQGKKRDSGSDSVKRMVEKPQSAIERVFQALEARDRKGKEMGEIAMHERDLLKDIAKHPLATVTDRYGRPGWSARTGNAVKRRSLEMGLLEQEKVSMPKGSVTLLKATGKGREFLRAEGIELKSLPKNASLEHEYWKHMVAEDYRNRGYSVEEEVPIGDGRAVDLVATKDGSRIAIEIETGKSNTAANLSKCEMAGFDAVKVVHTSRANG